MYVPGVTGGGGDPAPLSFSLMCPVVLINSGVSTPKVAFNSFLACAPAPPLQSWICTPSPGERGMILAKEGGGSCRSFMEELLGWGRVGGF